jgi:D-beta-D-heptose 7-phosphate kinase/D-beta-D-heptose 1-phosphate adenosyltransferase
LKVNIDAMNTERSEQIVNSFGKYKILVVGDVMLDHYVHGVVERLNPEAPVPILRAVEESQMTGGAGNVAKNAAMLGAKATLVGVVGGDKEAESVGQAAYEENYGADLVADDKRRTTLKTRYLVGNQQMVRVDHEDAEDVSGDVEEKILEAVKREIDKGVDAVLISDYAKVVVTQKVAETIIDMAGQKDILVAGDVKPSRAQYLLGASFVSPNLKEAYEYLGMNSHEKRLEPAELAKLVYMKMCSDVYLTLGKDGIYVYCGGECGRHVTQDHVVEVADESGAGDAAAVVLMMSLLAGASEEEASKLANAAGAVVVSKIGAQGVTPKELLQMYSKTLLV